MMISLCYLLPQNHVARAQASKSLRLQARKSGARAAEAPPFKTCLFYAYDILRR